MRKDFYVFRHGETDYNKNGRWQGCSVDTPLNETGKEQAKVLATELSDKDIEVIFSSNLKRAYETAQFVAQEKNLTIKTKENLREGDYGEAEEMFKTEMRVKFGDIFTQWYDNDSAYMDVRFPGGESKREMGRRMLGVFEELLQEEAQVIGVASHAGSLNCFWLYLGFDRPLMPNCSWLHLVYEDGKWSLD